MSARQFPAFGRLLTKEINPQKGTGGQRTAESEMLISESRQENGFGLLVCGVGGRGALVAKGVCGVSGQEPGRQRAWTAESLGGRGDCDVGTQGITRGRPAVLWRCFSDFRQFLSKCRRFRRQYLSGCSAPDGQLYRKRYQGFFSE